MKVTIKVGNLYLLVKHSPYYYSINGSKDLVIPDILNTNTGSGEKYAPPQTVTYPAVIRISSMKKLRSGLIQISFRWFTDELDYLVDTEKYLLICDDLLAYTLGLTDVSIPQSLVSKHVAVLNGKLIEAVKTIEDSLSEMVKLKEDLSILNHKIDDHVKKHDVLRNTLPNELIALCETASFEHEEFISYNNEMLDFLSGETLNKIL